MAPIKRNTSRGNIQGAHVKTFKRTGSEKVKPTPTKRSKIAEVETDSDPIIESDTASQSGDDDGVSWPSDQDNDAAGGLPVGENDGYGNGVKIAAKAADTAKLAKPKFTNNAPSISTSKETRAKQKATAQERKAAKPHADLIAQSKKIWERLRRKSHVPPDERSKLLTELFEIISGRVKEFVFKHDSVRVIQSALKYANLDQRRMIAEELRGDYKTLAQSKYAKFLVGKILVHGNNEMRDLVVPEFYGHVRRMIKHPEASWILDDIYRGAATSSQKAILLREWYGAEFALFQPNRTEPVSADLKQLLEENPEKKTPIMRSLRDLINLLVQKKTTGFTMLHDAMLQYFLNVQPGSEEATDFIELLKSDEEGDLLRNLAFTKSGAFLVCLALAYSNAKDRKLLLRAFKGLMQMMAYDSHAHQILLTAYDVIDDTVLISKTICTELVGKATQLENQQQEILNAMNDLYARASLLYPFSGRSKAILSGNDLKLIDDIRRIRVTTSKKDPEIRRMELISYLSPPLLSLITSHSRELVITSFGCQVITEVLLSATGDRQAAVAAVATLLQKDQDTPHYLFSPAASRMLKTLVQGGRFNPITKCIEIIEPSLGFHDIFYQRISGQLIDWATGPNSFVIVGLLESPGFSRAKEVKTRLENSRTRLEEAVVFEDRVKKEGKKKGKLKDGEDMEGLMKGNAGARILLEKLNG